MWTRSTVEALGREEASGECSRRQEGDLQPSVACGFNIALLLYYCPGVLYAPAPPETRMTTIFRGRTVRNHTINNTVYSFSVFDSCNMILFTLDQQDS